MAYLPKFENDLFVSYGHIDDSPLGDGKRGFVSRFHTDLQRRVNQYLGTEVKIWRDNSLAGNTEFPEEIERNLKSTAAWVPVLSPRFLSSSWCQREQGIFLNAVEATGGLKVGTRSRIFKVVTTLVELRALPETMQQVLGYEFGRYDENGRWREYDYDPSPEAEKLYLAKVDDLAYDLHLLLKELREAGLQPVNGNQTTLPGSSKGTIYLAETTRDLSGNRDQIRRELLAQGYQVLPDRPLPPEVNELRSLVSSQLASCRLSLHLIGGRYGVVPENEETRSVVWLQQELAVQRPANGSFHCLLWVPPGTEVVDERQKQYLNHLQEALRASNDFELLKTSFDGMKNYLFDKLAPPPQRVERGEKFHIYLICERRDLEAIGPIKEYLTDHNFGVDTPLMDGTQTEIRQDHEGFLQDCDGVLIYQGAGSEAWLREKIRDLRRARGLGRQKPFTPQVIYLGPESTDSKKSYKNDEFRVIRNLGDFSPDAMQPFLEVPA